MLKGSAVRAGKVLGAIAAMVAVVIPVASASASVRHTGAAPAAAKNAAVSAGTLAQASTAPARGGPAPTTSRGVLPPRPSQLTSAPQVQVCAPNAFCLNRYHGGYSAGTPVIDWYFNDPNNDFTFEQLGSWCGGTGEVRNGENGMFCPFAYGSGLNARYDGDAIYELFSYGPALLCAAIPNFSDGYVALESCGSNGYAWVYSKESYMVSVGESNFAYRNGNGPNNPFWLWYAPGTVGGQLDALPNATEQWFCYGHGIGSC
jgi:hypothetical protein